MSSEKVSKSTKSQKPSKYQHIGIFFMLLTCVCYSANSILAKVIVVGAAQIGLFRVCVMYLFVIPVLLRHGVHGVDDVLGPTHIRKILILRGFSGSLSGLTFYLAVKHASPGLATSIAFLDVVLVPIFGRIILKEALTPLDIVFAGVTFSGVVLIARPPFLFPSAEGDTENLTGILYAIASAVLGSFSYLLLRKIGNCVNPLVPTFYFTSVSLVLYSAIIVVTGEFEFPCLTQVGYLCLIALCGFFGMIFLTIALHTERPSTISVINTLQIVIVLLVQILFLHDMPPKLSIVGSCLIFSTSICLGIRKIVNERRSRAQNTPTDSVKARMTRICAFICDTLYLVTMTSMDMENESLIRS